MTYNAVLDFTTVRGISADIEQDRDVSNTDAYHKPSDDLDTHEKWLYAADR